MATSFTIDLGQGPVALPYGPFRDVGDVGYSVQVLDTWSDEDLAAIGVVRSEASDPVPPTVSRRQAKQALNTAGLLEHVEAAVAGASAEVRIYWADESVFHRDHLTLEAIRLAVGWTNPQLDEIFVAAATVV